MKHYDCHNQNVKLEQFYGAETQLELSEGADPEAGCWGAEVHWSE